MSQKISLAGYLFTRIRQLGARSVHGVPSDYNMTILDALKPVGLHFAGNSNELNAGYAADGYARVKGISALCTGFGVGELSAINAVGGAYAERAAVVHVVGTPPRAAQRNGMNVHHTLGDGNHRIFADMYRGVTCAQVNLTNEETARASIDMTLRECLRHSRPVYIELPTDMVNIDVGAEPLATSINTTFIKGDMGNEDEVTRQISERIRRAKQPMIMIDAFTRKFGWAKEAQALAEVTGFPVTTTTGGKDVIDEQRTPNYYGVYKGACGDTSLKDFVESCDLVLRLGPLDCDTNTFGFSTIPKPAVSIDFHNEDVIIGDSSTNQSAPPETISVNVHRVLQNLHSQLSSTPSARQVPHPSVPNFAKRVSAQKRPQDQDKITQEFFYTQISSFFRTHDVILTETGTASSGGLDFHLPSQTQLITSPIWLSIGYTLGASAGCALALRDRMHDQKCNGEVKGGRTVLFEGDGSFQMTAQTISDVIRNRLDMIIFVINNDGYTIERLIHGMQEKYNDVQPWRYLLAPEFFGAPKDDPAYPIVTEKAKTWGELRRILRDERVEMGKGLCIIEVFMEKEDGPDCLKKLAAYVAERNSKYA